MKLLKKKYLYNYKMFGLKNDEMLTCFLLIVVGYIIAKMFSRRCEGFSVGFSTSEPELCPFECCGPTHRNCPEEKCICPHGCTNVLNTWCSAEKRSGAFACAKCTNAIEEYLHNEGCDNFSIAKWCVN